jgi:hypothetical protein
MKRIYKYLIMSALLGALLLAGCEPTSIATSSGGVHVWVDQPVTSALLPVAPFTLRAHATRAGGGIVKMAFLVNSLEVGNAGTDPAEVIVTAEADWTPPGPGQYLVQAQAFSAEGVNTSEASLVCVSASATEPLVGYAGACDGTQQPRAIIINPVQTLTMTPTSQQPTATPSGKTGTSKENLKCHAGPGTVFSTINTLAAGDIAEVIGRSKDGLWLIVKLKTGQSPCWVLANYIEPQFDPLTLPLFESPPTPLPTYTPTIPPTETPAPAAFDCGATYGSSSAPCLADKRCDFIGKVCVNR